MDLKQERLSRVQPNAAAAAAAAASTDVRVHLPWHKDLLGTHKRKHYAQIHQSSFLLGTNVQVLEPY